MKNLSSLEKLDEVRELVTLVTKSPFVSQLDFEIAQKALVLLDEILQRTDTKSFSTPVVQAQNLVKDDVARFILHFKTILRLKNGVSKETTPPRQ